MIIQIYEIQAPGEAEEMISLGVDHIGTVLTGKKDLEEPRLRETVALAAAKGAKSSLLPLTDDIDLISSALEHLRPHIVHFCQGVFDSPGGWEQACGRMMSVQATVKERFPGIEVMRSIPVPPPGEAGHLPVIEAAFLFEPLTDYFLIDTLMMEGGSVADQPETGYVGITGRTCDWQTAAEIVSQSSIPVILAGGLSPDNVREAIHTVRPAGVDSCTLTNATDETGAYVRFKKDPQKVAKFVEQTRMAGREMGAS
ncbi:MAG: phosphoribosylanthranilate isomerase [Desulfobacterales bacterium]